MKTLKMLYGLGVVFSILSGFFIRLEQAVFPWHKVPSWEAIFGVLGALLLLVGVKVVGIIVIREETFYD
jgi:hypothetical protein